jgi:hypothetical protein
VATAVLRLAGCAEVLPGFSIAGRMEHDPKGTHQVLLTRHLRDGVPYRFEARDELRIVPGRGTARYEVHSGDVVFMSRGTRNLAWAIAAVPVPTIVSVSFYILRPKAEVEPSYLAWYLNQPPAQGAIDQIRTGAGTPIVQRAAFERLEVVVPAPDVQSAIGHLAELQARERQLRAGLVEATDRLHAAAGHEIIERLWRHAPRRRTS